MTSDTIAGVFSTTVEVHTNDTIVVVVDIVGFGESRYTFQQGNGDNKRHYIDWLAQKASEIQMHLNTRCLSVANFQDLLQVLNLQISTSLGLLFTRRALSKNYWN